MQPSSTTSPRCWHSDPGADFPIRAKTAPHPMDQLSATDQCTSLTGGLGSRLRQIWDRAWRMRDSDAAARRWRHVRCACLSTLPAADGLGFRLRLIRDQATGVSHGSKMKHCKGPRDSESDTESKSMPLFFPFCSNFLPLFLQPTTFFLNQPLFRPFKTLF